MSPERMTPVRRAHRPLRLRARATLFLLPAWFSPASSLRAAFHRLRGARIARSAEIGYLVMIDNLYPEKVTIEEEATVAALGTVVAGVPARPIREPAGASAAERGEIR